MSAQIPENDEKTTVDQNMAKNQRTPDAGNGSSSTHMICRFCKQETWNRVQRKTSWINAIFSREMSGCDLATNGPFCSLCRAFGNPAFGIITIRHC